MTGSSTVAGYIRPSNISKPPNRLTLLQFIQTVLVGLSGIDGSLVRPKWQPKPPPQPDPETNWIAFGIIEDEPTFNGAIVTDNAGVTTQQRQRKLTIQTSFYGPNALDFIELVQDGFQLGQNLAALKSANMGLTETTRAIHIPELVNEVWIDRYEMSVILQREVISTYPIVTITSASGTIFTPTTTDDDFSIDWLVTD